MELLSSAETLSLWLIDASANQVFLKSQEKAEPEDERIFHYAAKSIREFLRPFFNRKMGIQVLGALKMASNELAIWKPADKAILPTNAKTPSEIVNYALQLSTRDRKQVAQGFKAGNYEMALNFVWIKAMASLKRELSSVGINFLGEMLGKPEINEDVDVVDLITDREAIKLSEELGVVSSTEAMRLRQAQELVSHFSKLDPSLVDEEDIEMDEHEAIGVLKTCIKNILGKPKIEVATEFVQFREALESKTLSKDDPQVQTLQSSPYFFRSLTINILLSVIKEATGAKLEHSLANLNVILPLLWDNIRETEKWQVGRTYAEAHANGELTAMSGLRKALLKVQGFDFVPESLRSAAFIEAAEKVIKAHEGFDNFYLEEAPMKVLKNLGTVIPAPAFSICASAIMSVRLGNSYGKSWYASPIAGKMLLSFTRDRWEYYFNQCLPSDVRILDKLIFEKPTKEFFSIVSENDLDQINVTNRSIKSLILAASKDDVQKVQNFAKNLRKQYYGK